MEIKKKIIVIDLETTGFSPVKNEITEIGFVVLDGRTLENMGGFNTLVKIEGRVPGKITELTGISNDMTEKFGLPKDMVGEYLRGALEDSVLVAHNASFDFSFLAEHFDIDPKFYYDTLSLSRIVYPDEKKHNLKDVCARLGISLEGHHRALNDAMATADVLKHMLLERNAWKSMNVLHGGGRGIRYKPTYTRGTFK